MSWKIIVDMENCPYLGIELCSHVDSSQYCNESTCPIKDRKTDNVVISRELYERVKEGLYINAEYPILNDLKKEVEQ